MYCLEYGVGEVEWEMGRVMIFGRGVECIIFFNLWDLILKNVVFGKNLINKKFYCIFIFIF